jgi:hypothetical protein
MADAERTVSRWACADPAAVRGVAIAGNPTEGLRGVLCAAPAMYGVAFAGTQFLGSN